LKDVEVVAEMTTLCGGEITVHETGLTTDETIADPITMEQPSQEIYSSAKARVSPQSAHTIT
jgi:hypothetical protein